MLHARFYPDSRHRAARASRLAGAISPPASQDAALPPEPALWQQWDRILGDPNLCYFVADADGTLAASCTLAIIPNLTRGARPYGLIENVVTHASYRRRGIATRLLRHALSVAWERDCYKVMLLTGRESTHHFYEQAGFKKGTKTAFVATP